MTIAMKRNVPDEFQETFQRLMKSVPAELQNDTHLKKTTLLYLSLGGEALARQNIEIYKKRFPERLAQFNKPADDEIS
jgi:hypothetical protein